MSFYRGLFFVVAVLYVAVFSTGAFATVPLILTHQGRLLDATDKPVNGFFDITYRVYEVPTGGSPLWTEVHPGVQVADGLFSALLGSTVPLSADVLGSGGGGGGGGIVPERYLEVSVGGVALTPRLRLGSAPSAISTGHVSGDIETAPGQFTVTNNGSVNSGRLMVHTTADSAISVLGHDSNGDGEPEISISSSCDASSASEVMGKKGLNAVNVKLARTISSPPSGSLAQDYLDMDSDDDGVMDRSVSSSVDGLSAKHAINTKGTGATHNRVVSVSSSTTEDSANSVCSMDLDGDGLADRSVSSSADATSARLKVSNIGSSGQDGVELLALPTTSSVAIKTKGTGANDNRTITSATNPETATMLLAADLDGDGVMDNTSSDSVDVSGASRRLKSSGIGSSGNDGIEVQLSARSKKGDIKVSASQNSQTLRCSASADSAAATMLVAGDVDGDGVPEGEISQIVTPTTTSVAIKTKGTGAEANKTASLTVTGSPGGSISSACANDLDGDGVADNTVLQSCDASGARLEVHNLGSSGNDGVEISVLPMTSSVAIKTKGTGANDNRSASLVCAADLDGDGTLDRSVSTTADSTTAGIAIDEPGVQIGMKVVNKGTVKGNITVTNSSAMKIQLDSDGNGFFANKIGIGKDPIEKIDVEGGAYCDGTNWVNASDRNSKENFTAVDGNELLDQIAQLSITRWNYKGNNQAEHIGPTAQDFKAAFGVGANDKTISTIDPSGIALAAIKALNSKMQELNAKTSQLEDQAREIIQLKAELDAIKALIQKQAATKN